MFGVFVYAPPFGFVVKLCLPVLWWHEKLTFVVKGDVRLQDASLYNICREEELNLNFSCDLVCEFMKMYTF